MKKILILAYDFPPYVSVGGLRPCSWHKYLKEFGVEPIVVTRQWGNEYGNHLDYIAPSESNHVIIEHTEYGRIIRAPYFPTRSNRMLLERGNDYLPRVRKMLTAYHELGQFPFPIGPKRELYKAAQEFLKNEKVDAIIATSEPFVLFKYAAQLSKQYIIPWIADYRDPWSQNEGRVKNGLVKKVNVANEKKWLASVDYICTVSPFIKAKIEELLPEKQIAILENGYDPEIVNDVSSIRQNSDYLSIAFVGSIYHWHPLDLFLRSAKEFIDQHKEVKMKFKFYGTNKNEFIKKQVEQEYPSLKAHIELFPKLSNEELLRKLREDHVMLIFNDYSIMGTKIYDYLGIRRKMILCFSEDPEALELKRRYYIIDESSAFSKTMQEDLIKSTQSGIVVKDSKNLIEVFNELYAEFQDKREIACNSVGVEQFSRKVQVEKLAELVKRIAQAHF